VIGQARKRGLKWRKTRNFTTMCHCISQRLTIKGLCFEPTPANFMHRWQPAISRHQKVASSFMDNILFFCDKKNKAISLPPRLCSYLRSLTEFLRILKGACELPLRTISSTVAASKITSQGPRFRQSSLKYAGIRGKAFDAQARNGPAQS
jgi:hypothetical protein